MPRDRRGDKKRPKKGQSPKIYEETMQVRVRKKNPLIERKASAPIDDDDTRAVPGINDLLEKNARVAEPRVESVAQPSIYDNIEHTDRTEEIDVAAEHLSAVLEAETERPTPRAVAYLDEDETIIATNPPAPSEPWAEEHTNDFRMKRGVQKRSNKGDSNGAIPRGRVGMTGTKGAGAAVRRQMIENDDDALPAVKSPALKIVRGELTRHELASLDRALGGELDSKTMDGSISPKRSLERLVNEREWNELVPKHRAALLRPIAKDPGDLTTVKAAIALVKTVVLRHLPPDAATKLLDVFASLGADARAHMAQMAARRLRRRSVLEDKDLEDRGLVDHLHHLVIGRSFSERIESAGARQRKVSNLVVGAIASPHRLSFEEGSDGVLSAIEFALAETNPAELLRLWRGLVSDALSVPLKGGGQLDLEKKLENTDVEFSGQNTPLRVALALLADIARPSAKVRRPTFTMPGGHGVDADIVSRALEQIYGVGFTVAAGARNALRHLERIDKDPHRAPPVFVSMLYARGERLFILDHVDKKHVYVRAPHGRSTKEKGAFRMDPRREVVDQEHGIDRIDLPSFEKHVGVGLIPRR